MLNDIEQATARLLETAGRFTDADLRQPSLLPGWSRAYVLAHLARGGEALRNILVDEPPYASRQARNADIEAGSDRTAAELVGDVAATAEAFRATVLGVPPERWDDVVSVPGVDPFPRSQVLLRRLTELELHHVDLDAGYTAADWPPSFAGLDMPEPLRSWRADRG
ncbi:maleylpyruvate isomerase family mycothiol-dependent enzyme [Couchioplanes caeruleus]|uniref:maleylpyruvate isomerase N-terminal domain-containing protein n=1 Tax=Couchioplanes caeruleus TaxID=56438 RepID=UPI00201BB723|nr:maleylpyruvate isomerase family mycothiol-dependent enzyme [Couchioplanes caeruleus]UQU67247.1 maleylpyruvate isomerase family mycothiol-dependent enzyme [Couchioplanes caeruleus]